MSLQLIDKAKAKYAHRHKQGLVNKVAGLDPQEHVAVSNKNPNDIQPKTVIRGQL